MKYNEIIESLVDDPCTIIEVYVDDYIYDIYAKNNISIPELQRLSRCILHEIHSIFPPPDITGHEGDC